MKIENKYQTKKLQISAESIHIKLCEPLRREKVGKSMNELERLKQKEMEAKNRNVSIGLGLSLLAHV